jgi:glycosyltransferase involved in cell wall biosynthesis
MWRDHGTLRAAAGLIAARASGQRLLFIALGDDVPTLRVPGIDVLPIGQQTDPRTVARYLQAADVYLHSARADTFPISILEALACGTPVVATAVGGIPEQVRPAPLEAVRHGAFERLGPATGLLVPVGDAAPMAEAVAALAADSATRRVLGNNARRDACERFDVERQVECYLGWYRTIIDDWNRHAVSDRRRTPTRVVGQERMALD